MDKIKVTPERFHQVCSILEYLGASAGSKDTAARLAHRFVVNADNEYIVKVNYDDNGTISSFENIEAALLELATVNLTRLERLTKELMEAAKAIVNPPKEGT